MIKTYQSPHLPPAISWGWRMGLHSILLSGRLASKHPPSFSLGFQVQLQNCMQHLASLFLSNELTIRFPNFRNGQQTIERHFFRLLFETNSSSKLMALIQGQNKYNFNKYMYKQLCTFAWIEHYHKASLSKTLSVSLILPFRVVNLYKVSNSLTNVSLRWRRCKKCKFRSVFLDMRQHNS